MSSSVNGNDVCDTMGVTKVINQPQIVVLTEALWVREEDYSLEYATILVKANYCPFRNGGVHYNQPGWLVPQDTVSYKGSVLASVLKSWALSSSDQIKHGDKKSTFMPPYVTYGHLMYGPFVQA